jgi:hypothetical protein
MSQSALSMIVFGGYLLIAGVVFIVDPNPLITFLGFDPVTDVWIRVAGLIVVIVSYYYFMAVKEKAYNFFRWTAFARLPIFFVYLGFVILDLSPPVLLVFGVFETGCAIWTGLALKKEHKI